VITEIEAGREAFNITHNDNQPRRFPFAVKEHVCTGGNRCRTGAVSLRQVAKFGSSHFVKEIHIQNPAA